jgi:hypothetical protein
MTTKRWGRKSLELWTALVLVSCAGRSVDHRETDTNTNWLERCEEGDLDCDPLEPRRAPSRSVEMEIPASAAPRAPLVLPPDAPAPDSCVVRCAAVLSGNECRDTARIPGLGQTVVSWQGMDCAAGPLLEGQCAGGTRFVWRGGATTEVRYFRPDGAFIGLSSILGSPDPSTCNGVRRWPQQVTCDSPVVTRELCADRASADADTLIDASEWLEHLGELE